MKKVLYSKFDKKRIDQLPIAQFQGRIIVIITKGETKKAVDYLLSQGILGVDTETRPSFEKGKTHRVSLLQVSTYNICFLFRLNLTGITPDIMRLLEDTSVPKIGISWHDDILGLQKRCKFTPGYFIDIQDLIGELGIEDKSLQKLYANFFHERIIKRQQLSNWENRVLTDKQKLYAATDAWACLKIYDEITRLLKTKDFELEIVKDELQDNIPEEREG
ncbi:MAG: 3'-5' exonuclease domain-containing protein 2 [Prevotella sp.]|nr:3'-5' exonuclease domain-containing protein 2 [Prevotella sp.]